MGMLERSYKCNLRIKPRKQRQLQALDHHPIQMPNRDKHVDTAWVGLIIPYFDNTFTLLTGVSL